MRCSSSVKNIAALAIMCAAFAGCTSVTVKPLPAQTRIQHICIQDNPRVQVGDFVSVMQEGFQKHAITSQLVNTNAAGKCEYTSTYTATRTWDMAMYMTDAQIDILRDGRQIAFANYHLKGGGGLSLNKWANTRTKILPVIDEMLALLPVSDQFVTVSATAPPLISEKPVTEGQSKSELARKLSELKDAFDAELITKEEYEAKHKALIDEL
jgi:hypothetical protein